MKKILAFLCGLSACMCAQFSQLLPENGAVLPLLKEKHKAFLADRQERQEKNFSDWQLANELTTQPSDDCRPLAVTFTWHCEEGVVPLQLLLAGDGVIRRVPVEGRDSVVVANLMAGISYRWFLEGTDSTGEIVRSSSSSFTTEGQAPRLIDLPGISNVRDCGGWRTADGKHVLRQGLLYRGGEFDGHQHIGTEGLWVLQNDLRLKTDLDLRGVEEIEIGLTGYPLEPIGVKLVNIPMPSLDFETLGHKQAVAEIMHFLANPAVYPLYVHCWGGADRTGELVMLLQAILGVGDEELFDDYEMTSFGCWGPRSRNSEIYTKFLNALQEYGDENTPIAVKAEAFLKEGGLTQYDIDTLRAIFLKKL